MGDELRVRVGGFEADDLSSEKISCTMQLPFHSTIGRPVFSMMYRPRFLSGAKMIGVSLGTLFTMAIAFELVQMMSLIALISAVQLM